MSRDKADTERWYDMEYVCGICGADVGIEYDGPSPGSLTVTCDCPKNMNSLLWIERCIVTKEAYQEVNSGTRQDKDA